MIIFYMAIRRAITEKHRSRAGAVAEEAPPAAFVDIESVISAFHERVSELLVARGPHRRGSERPKGLGVGQAT